MGSLGRWLARQGLGGFKCLEIEGRSWVGGVRQLESLGGYLRRGLCAWQSAKLRLFGSRSEASSGEASVKGGPTRPGQEKESEQIWTISGRGAPERGVTKGETWPPGV